MGKVSDFFFFSLDFPVDLLSCWWVGLFSSNLWLAGRLVIAFPWWKGDDVGLRLCVSMYWRSEWCLGCGVCGACGASGTCGVSVEALYNDDALL